MRLLKFWIVVALCGWAPGLHAQNPNWPNPEADRADLKDPANWPDDPSYGYDIEGDGQSCASSAEQVCWSRATGGAWNYWSWVPPEAEQVEGFRSEEQQLGAGTWADMAWRETTGDPRVVIAVLDSGIEWDNRDLVNQHYINRAELEADGLDPRCLPEPPEGHTGDPVDIDGDGVLGMNDWFAGKSEQRANTLREELDAAGNENGIADPGDLIVLCSNGKDEDGNGYTDDISGWDTFHDDNDPYDDTDFGHGTGEAEWSAAEGNNGIGGIGHCPDCRVLNVRVGDSFVPDVQDYAQGVLFSVDSGARVIQEALGSINHSTYMRRANDYAYRNGALVIASAADENSRHHNFPGTSNHALYVHAIRYAGGNAQNAESYLAFNNCTNYGGQLALSAPGTGCSSEATGVTAGIAGLVHAAAMSEERPGGPMDPPLHAGELQQLLTMNADDIHVPESQPDHPEYDDRWYPSRPGWDQRFGYGRVNAWHSVEAVRQGRIPPEVDVVFPDWFRVVYPERTPTVEIRGTVAAQRADGFDYVVEWAPGIEPTDEDFQSIASGSDRTEPLEGVLANWDVSDVQIDNSSAAVENRYTVTVRVRAVAKYGGDVGQVQGEARRVFAIHRDPSLLEGFPVALGVENDADIHQGASGEAAPKLADLDGDGDAEIVYGDADGLVHVLQADGSEMAGYPVQVGPLRGLDPAEEDNQLAAEAYASGEVPAGDVSPSILASPAIGDVDADDAKEIVIATMEGAIHVLNAADGTVQEGWPVELPEVRSGDPLRMGPTGPDHKIAKGVFAAPSLGDLDSDGQLEIVIAALDGHVYVYRGDGSMQPGFPVEVVAPILWSEPSEAQPGRIMTSPAIGDVNGDGLLDISVGSNEQGFQQNTGAIHVLHGDGTMHSGGAAHDNWPAQLTSADLLPVVGEGTPSNVALADLSGDDRPELALTGTASPIFAVKGQQPPRDPGESLERLFTFDSAVRGRLSDPDLIRTDVPLLNTFGHGSFGDMNADGVPDFATGGAGAKLAVNLAGGWKNQPFNHQVGAWDGADGDSLPGFPQIIEDYLFFVNPTVADVSGDGYPEVIAGSGGYYLHAWDACGREPEGWPKFVGGWVASSVATGDIDGDGSLEVVVPTRNGYMYAFDSQGPADGAIEWPEYQHDNHNTGNYEMPLPGGRTSTLPDEPLECPSPPGQDAGTGRDAGTGDAGPRTPGGGGCDCTVGSGADQPTGNLWPLLGALALLGLRRRRGR